MCKLGASPDFSGVKMNHDRAKKITQRLTLVLIERRKQKAKVAPLYPPDTLQFDDEMTQLKEYLDVNEYGIAYESIVAALEQLPFILTGKAAVSLLEVGLALGFKFSDGNDPLN
jgi:hypothetical protein